METLKLPSILSMRKTMVAISLAIILIALSSTVSSYHQYASKIICFVYEECCDCGLSARLPPINNKKNLVIYLFEMFKHFRCQIQST